MAPKIRRRLGERPDVRELPAVRGRTVIPADYRHPVVVGHPNYLGAFEPERATALIYLIGAWSALQPVPDGATSVAVEPSHPRSIAAKALENTRVLAKHLRQIPGVHVAFKPRSPVLILHLPHLVGSYQLPKAMDTLDDDYPEFPGGLRVELAPDVTAPDITRYAAIIEQIIGQEA